MVRHDSIAEDFASRPAYDRALQTYAQVDAPTRALYEGFAAGVDRYIELHPTEFPDGFAPHFTGYDVLANDVDIPSLAAPTRLVA